MKNIILEKDGLFVKAQAFMGTFEGYPDWQCTQDMVNGDISHITKNGWTRYDFTYPNSNTHAYYGYVNLNTGEVVINNFPPEPEELDNDLEDMMEYYGLIKKG